MEELSFDPSQNLTGPTNPFNQTCLTPAFDFDPPPIEQAEERVIYVGLSARMSERIMFFIIREFRSSHINCE